jgi:hypothetical protein
VVQGHHGLRHEFNAIIMLPYGMGRLRRKRSCEYVKCNRSYAGRSLAYIDASSCAYIFYGGILLLVGGLLELLLSNTFSAVVFMSFGMFISPRPSALYSHVTRHRLLRSAWASAWIREKSAANSEWASQRQSLLDHRRDTAAILWHVCDVFAIAR